MFRQKLDFERLVWEVDECKGLKVIEERVGELYIPQY